MKLIIQIPCYNEENTVEQTIRDLPNKIEGIDIIEYMVIDDGSTDKTIEIAEKCGVHHIVKNIYNKGLSATFLNGISHALSLGADIIVNTDGDNQYCGKDIPKLVMPILAKRADIVVGSRPIADHPEFNIIKKVLQLAGSWVLRQVSKTNVRDAASGFRAFSRKACMRINLYSKFSYCMETLIQAGNSDLKVESVDINVNPKTRESRLFKNVFQYIFKSGTTIISMFMLYRPGKFFLLGSVVSFLISFIIGIRYLLLTYFVSTPDPTRTYVPSLVLLSIFATFGMILLIMSIFGQIIKAQRKLLEEILHNQRQFMYSKNSVKKEDHQL